MRVLVACEFSATVRDAFRSRGHDAWSCDLEPTEGDPTYHIQRDAVEVAHDNPWDMVIAFPPCTDFAVSGARWWPAKREDGRQQAAVEFVAAMAEQWGEWQ